MKENTVAGKWLYRAACRLLFCLEKRIAELDKLFTGLYEDNVSGKFSDERFIRMPANYDDEQQQYRKRHTFPALSGLSPSILNMNVLTPEIMHELVEKIVVHAPDKSSGHREQRVEIYFRFNAASASAALNHGKKRKAA